MAMFQGIDVEKVNPAFLKIDNNNVFIGILAGLIAGAMYNRFSHVKLPAAVSFFSGRRLVPIVTVATMALVSLLLMFVWPVVFTGLTMFGESIVSLGPLGAGLYGFFNRLLIPTGLHHALNNVFWFDAAGINDIGNFWASKGTKGITGMYQAGFFPVMMFGLPAGAFAIYRCSRPEKRKQTASLMLAAGFASFFTGVTEPLEFSFMFVAWPLYVVHAVLTGTSLAVAALFHWTAGFNFSAGFIDYFLSLRVPIANMPLMLLVQGVAYAVIYYFVFMFVIKKFNLMTPGRETDDIDAGPAAADSAVSGEDKYAVLASRIYSALGADSNIETIDNCTTRLRLTVKDTSLVDQARIKAAGAPGVNVLDKKNIQVVVGTDVQFVADEMKKIRSGEKKPVAASAAPAAVAAAPKASGASVTQDIFAVADGALIPIEKVNDPTFAEKMLGDGYAVIPTNGEIYTPIAGKVVTVFPTKHAVAIATDSGVEVLLHMGIDTVKLDGGPFTVAVKEGDVVAQGQLIATADLDAIKAAGKGTEMVVIFTNGDGVESLNVVDGRAVSANEVIGSVTSK